MSIKSVLHYNSMRKYTYITIKEHATVYLCYNEEFKSTQDIQACSGCMYISVRRWRDQIGVLITIKGHMISKEVKAHERAPKTYCSCRKATEYHERPVSASVSALQLMVFQNRNKVRVGAFENIQ